MSDAFGSDDWGVQRLVGWRLGKRTKAAGLGRSSSSGEALHALDPTGRRVKMNISVHV